MSIQRAIPEMDASVLGTILIVILIVMLVGAVRPWEHSKKGDGARGLGLALLIVLVLVLLGRI